MMKNFSRKGAKAQRKTQSVAVEFEFFFAPLRLCGRNILLIAILVICFAFSQCPGFQLVSVLRSRHSQR